MKMTIREYFDSLMDTMDFDEWVEYQDTLYRCCQEDFEDFELWALENGIDLEARENGELVLTLWCWDCEE